jgi:oligosaccharide repeat unit polymerase
VRTKKLFELSGHRNCKQTLTQIAFVDWGSSRSGSLIEDSMNPETQVGRHPAGTVVSKLPLKVALSLLGVLIGYLLIELQILPALRVSTLLLIVASASFLFVKGRGKTDVLNPIRILGALWCFCLALGNMRLLPIVSEWSSLMWNCMLTGLASFIGGYWIATRVTRGRGAQLRPATAEVASEKHMLPTKKTLILASICLLIGTSVLAYEDFLIGGIPILADNPDVLRFELFGAVADPRFDTLSIKLIHPFVEFLKYGVFLVFILLFQKKPKSRKAILLGILIILLGTLVYGSQAGRTFFVTIAITGVVLFHYLRRRIRLVEIGAAVMALFLFIGIFGSVRTNQSQSAPLFERALRNSSFPQGQLWQGVAFGYMTVTVSFEVFYRLTEDLRNMRHPPGGFLFYSLHRFIPRTNLGLVATDLYSGESVTSTFLGDFYGDYGYWGILFGPLIMGFLYGWVYSRGGRRNPMYWIYVRALLIQMLIFFPYVNLFSLYLTWIFDLLVMYFLIGHLSAQEANRAPPLAETNAQDMSLA